MSTRSRRLLFAWLMPLLLLTAQVAVAQHEMKHLMSVVGHADKKGDRLAERAACDQCFAFAPLAGAIPAAPLYIAFASLETSAPMSASDTLHILDRVQPRTRDPPPLS